jgi:anti-sigma factor RsiW
MSPSLPCPGVERLQELVLGRLPPADAAGLAEHLRGCPRCQAALPTLEAGASVAEALGPAVETRAWVPTHADGAGAPAGAGGAAP